jgi:hypothetical protein
MTNTKTSKKSIFISAFNALPVDMKRKEALAILSEQCGLSMAGASTYYANCKSGLWSTGTVQKESYLEMIALVTGEYIAKHRAKEQANRAVQSVTQKSEKINLEVMTGSELVALYNSKVSDAQQIVKFRNKAEGIKRVAALIG